MFWYTVMPLAVCVTWSKPAYWPLTSLAVLGLEKTW